MDAQRLGVSRWRHILGAGWIGQQSFVTHQEVTEALLPEPGLRVLDAGAGSGAFARWLALEHHCTVLAYDPWLTREDTATRQDDRLRLSPGTFESPPPNLGGDFDALVCLDAIQYAVAPDAALEANLSRIRPQGRVLISVWATGNRRLADRWDFTVWPPPAVKCFARRHGLSVSASPHFAERVHRQLESIVALRDAYCAVHGDQAYAERLALDSITEEAVQGGDLVQLRIQREDHS